VLDSRFGINQGFDYYDSPFDLSRNQGVDLGDIKRPGADVVASAQQWLEKYSGRGPFFVFLHLYDLHTPYNLSKDLQARYGAGYDGELAYVDDLVGRFTNYLRTKGLLNK